MKQECPAGEPGALGFDQAEHRLHGYSGINGGTAAFQYFHPRPRSKRVGAAHDPNVTWCVRPCRVRLGLVDACGKQQACQSSTCKHPTLCASGQKAISSGGNADSGYLKPTCRAYPDLG